MIQLTTTQIVKSILLIALLIGASPLFAQRVHPLVPGISVDSVLSTKPNATKLAMDPVSGHLFYTTSPGNIYEVYIPHTGTASDSLRYTVADHGISYLQGLYFRDSTVYICGNVWSATTGTGKVVKGVLQPNGTRVWIDIVTTDPYPTASNEGDHGFAGVNLDPAGNFIYVSSGARTHLGEVRTHNGTWPGYREVPLTTRVYKFPVNAEGIVLPNDSSLVDNSGYVFCWGTRNAYDMAWYRNDTLFAIDNSGERDDPEELNWLREGRNYGFPWRMGGNDNPLATSPYNVENDPLVNHNGGGYTSGWFADDPDFPPVPAGVVFTDPVRNYGTSADFFKDPVTGKIRKASDEGTYISSFTAHRSPLGLVFDKDSTLTKPFRGNGFVLSFMPGGDSTGYTPLSPWGAPCPFVDPSRELVQLKLKYDGSLDNYTMTTSDIVTGFYLPVDAELVNQSMYVIENGGDLWRINFLPEHSTNFPPVWIYPNPFDQSSTLEFHNPDGKNYSLKIYDSHGKTVRIINNITTGKFEIVKQDLEGGLYFYSLITENIVRATGKLIIQ